MIVKTDVVKDHDFRYPITEEQYEQSKFNTMAAIALVRRVHILDLEALAEKVRQ